MRARGYVDEDDEYEEDPRYDGGGGDWQPDADDDDDDEPDDSSDSDFGSKKKSRAKTTAKKAAAAKPRAAKAPTPRRPAAKKSRRHVSSDESDASESETDEDLDDGWAAPAARAASRPRRQAAQKATANIKHAYEEEADADGTGAVAAKPYSTAGTAYGATTAAVGSYRQAAPRSYAAASNAGYHTTADHGYMAADSYAGEGFAAAAPSNYYQTTAASTGGGYAAGPVQAAYEPAAVQHAQPGSFRYQPASAVERTQLTLKGAAVPPLQQPYSSYNSNAIAVPALKPAAAETYHPASNGNQHYASEQVAQPRSQQKKHPASPAQPLQQQRTGRRAVVKSYKETDSESDASGDYEADYEQSEEEASADDEAASDDGDEWEQDDYKYAQHLQEEWNGLRSRTTRSRRAGGSSSSPPARARSAGVKRGAGWGAANGASKRSRPGRAVAKVSYAESGDSDSDDAGRGSQARREPVPALDDVGTDERPGQQPHDEVERVLGHRDASGDDAPAGAGNPRWDAAEFHVKWKSYSYTHCSWESLSTLRELGGFKRVTNYCRRAELLEAGRLYMSREELELQDVQRQMEEQLVEQYTQVERVVSERPDAARCLLVKWEGLPYCECTWETEASVMAARGGPEARDDFLTRQQRLQEPSKGVDAARSSFISSKRSIAEMSTQPAFLAGGKLRDYQLEGINWLTYAWIKGRNCILADEMGLGKTVQCVSFLGLMAETCGVRGPFLVVVPLSTVPNWIKEFKKWVPMLNALVYVGNGRSREVIRTFEFGGGFALPGTNCSSNRNRPYNFEVLITTYELVLKDAPLLSKINWAYMMVDEAHRLKNSESALYQELAGWHFKNKLLITGTPLQNSLKELWALLHFLEPGQFNSCEDFEASYSLQDSEQVSQLHAALKPHLLRRVIKEVEKSLPPKNERILRVEMTPLQRQYYKWILSRNFKELNKGARSGGHVSLLNIISELKKACNHPFLFESAEDEYRGSEEDKSVVDRLILTSGKMVLLDKLLRRLRETGHRVLVFSQMVRVLDIISDYLRLRGWPHQRLDGSTPAAQRHAAMEAFNKPDSPDFAFLLSTRAGGLGINLATADTVVIFDSDWNPQNDLQAMSRAHRIGQTETVNIYRFVTSGSVEEEILERAKRKMVLDHLVIQRMDTSGRTVLDPAAAGLNKNAKAMFGKDELAAILRFGAEDLFKAAEEGSAERSKKLLEEDIDQILERAELVEQDGLAGAAPGPEGAADLLSSFNVATFKNDEDDATFWSRLIREEERPPDEEQQPLGLRAARIKALGADDVDDTHKPLPRSHSASPDGSDAEGGDAGHKAAGAAKARKSSKRKKCGSNEPGPPVEGAVLRVDEWCWEVDESGRPTDNQEAGARSSPSSVHTLSRKDATAFVRAVRRHGLKSRLPAVAAEVGGAVEDADLPQQRSLWRALVDGCKQALDVAQQGQQQEGKDVTLDFFGYPVKAGELTHHLSSMSLLAKRIDALTAAHQDPASSFRLEAAAVPPAAKWGKAVGWTPRDDAALLLGVYYHGLGHWEEIIGDEWLGLQGKLQCVLLGREESTSAAERSLMPKGSHLETRVLGILRKMLSSSNKPAPGHARSNSAQRTAAHLPPKKAAAARAAALAAAGVAAQRKLTPPPGAAAAVGQSLSRAHTPPLPISAAAASGNATDPTEPAADPYGPFTAEQLQEQLASVSDALKELAKLSEQELEPRQVMALTKKHLLHIGHAVERAAAANSDMRKPLWRYIISVIKSPMSEDDIVKVYNRLHRQAIFTAGPPSAADPASASVKAAGAAGARPGAGAAPKPRPKPKPKQQVVPGLGPSAPAPPAAATPPSAAAPQAAGLSSGKKPKQQQQQPVVHAGPSRALQLHKQPDQIQQQKQQPPQQQQQKQQPLQQQQQQQQQQHIVLDRNTGLDQKDRQRSRSREAARAAVQAHSPSRGRGRSRSTDRQGHHYRHNHRSRSHSRGRQRDSRQHHRGRSRSRDRYRRRYSRSSSRSRSRDRQRHRDYYSSRHGRSSRSYSRSRSRSRSSSRGRRYRRSSSRDRRTRRSSRSHSREGRPAAGHQQQQHVQQHAQQPHAHQQQHVQQHHSQQQHQQHQHQHQQQPHSQQQQLLQQHTQQRQQPPLPPGLAPPLVPPPPPPMVAAPAVLGPAAVVAIPLPQLPQGPAPVVPPPPPPPPG